MNKLFDLRFVIGSFFTIVGLLLLIHSFMVSQKIEHESINRWSSIVFLVFGILMVVVSLREDASDELIDDSPEAKKIK